VNAAAPVDPQIAALLAMASGPPLLVATTRDDIQAVRDQRSALALTVPLTDDVERTDHDVPAHPDVRVRVHRPAGRSGPLPCVVSLHGGGYMVGSYVDEDARHDRLCQALGYVGVAVDYRLAPETAYPGAIEDAYAALKWVYDNAADLGVDASRIGIYGASAGGGLAAGLALLARDRGQVPVAFQQLIYPMIDDRPTPSKEHQVPLWNRPSNDLGWSCYLGSLYGADQVPPYAVPARAADLSGLPPAFICVGTADIFCDENITYAQRLNQAGVPVELHVYPGAPHGFDIMPGAIELASRCRRDQEEWLARQLAGS
jgi:acetyl esterase/lipase